VRREDFEHVIAAAANVTGEDEFVVIGSQAVLGSFPAAPETMLRSMEADVYPLHRPEKADDIDGALGDGSQFEATFGYYAHGVGPETAKAPAGWQERLVRVPVQSRLLSDRHPVAWCLEIHDLVLAKVAARRERDWDFAREALKAGLVGGDELLRRAEDLPLEPPALDYVLGILRGIVDAEAGADGRRR
jgi:hypothetical protein